MSKVSEAALEIPDGQPDVEVVERPWGAFEQYAHNQPVTVSLMSVKPGQRLSLQAHSERAELWIVLDEGAVVQVGDEVRRPQVGERVWIPANTQHRLASERSKGEARVLEVAFGSWQQDDITRFEDDYARPERGE